MFLLIERHTMIACEGVQVGRGSHCSSERVMSPILITWLQVQPVSFPIDLPIRFPFGLLICVTFRTQNQQSSSWWHRCLKVY